MIGGLRWCIGRPIAHMKRVTVHRCRETLCQAGYNHGSNRVFKNSKVVSVLIDQTFEVSGERYISVYRYIQELLL